jgi:hypothetical protein
MNGRLRWGLRATLALGVAASVAANILHARPNPISQGIAAWPPVALLLTVEWITRVPVRSRYRSAARIATTAVIAGIAAWVSYWHMAGVAARYGETGSAPYLLPFSVDGLIVIASISLVELTDRTRAPAPSIVDTPSAPVSTVDTRPAPPALGSPVATVPVSPDAFARANGTAVHSGAPR